MAGLLRSAAYDVVHIHVGLVSPLAFAAIAAAVDSGLPVVVTLHSLLSLYQSGFRALDALTGWAAWPVQWTAVSDVAAAVPPFGRPCSAPPVSAGGPEQERAGRGRCPTTPGPGRIAQL
jgi:hypothetical protein